MSSLMLACARLVSVVREGLDLETKCEIAGPLDDAQVCLERCGPAAGRDTEHLQLATDALGFYADEVNGRKPRGSKPRRSTTITTITIWGGKRCPSCGAKAERQFNDRDQ